MKEVAVRLAEKLKKLEEKDFSQIMYIEGRVDVLLEQKEAKETKIKKVI